MEILELQLQARDLGAQQDFYGRVLQMPVLHDAPDRLDLRAGRSRLTFTPAAAGESGAYHFAFNVPAGQFAAAKAWLQRRLPLIADGNGEDSFRFADWHAEACYFYDPAGNIVEFIARHDLPDPGGSTFSGADVLSVSEIGLAVADVPASVRNLHFWGGLPVYSGEGSDSFAALGDPSGLLILVRQGRIWFPATGKAATAAPLTALMRNAEGAKLKLTGPPYDLTRAARS